MFYQVTREKWCLHWKKKLWDETFVSSSYSSYDIYNMIFQSCIQCPFTLLKRQRYVGIIGWYCCSLRSLHLAVFSDDYSNFWRQLRYIYLSLYRYHHLIEKHSSQSIAVLNGCTTANNYTAQKSNVEFGTGIGVVVHIDFLWRILLKLLPFRKCQELNFSLSCRKSLK